MKTLHIPLEDEDYRNLEIIKGEMTWNELIKAIILSQQNQENQKEVNENGNEQQ